MSKQSDAPHTPLAIVGMGCLFPQADGLEAYWANIKEGIDAITEIPESHWRPDDYFDANPKCADHTYGRRGGFLEPIAFDPLKYGISPNAIEATDTSQLLGMMIAERALRDAGYDETRGFDRRKVSVILGVTGALELVIPLGARLGHPVWKKALREAGVDNEVVEDVSERIAGGYVEWQEASFPGLLGNVVAGRISKYLDLGGTNCVVDAACASSLSALHLASLELSSGKADAVVTGGIDTFNDIFMYMCFSKTPALSPGGHARPFDQNADGTTLGEGLGVLVLKRLADAEREGDRVYAVVKGIGSSSDGKGDAIYAPVAAGQEKALREAYANAGVTPDTIELIEAHGTGTKRGDAVEVSALTKVFGEAAKGKTPWCAIGSVKSQIGHTKAAAGAAGLIKAALALHHKVLPPTVKVEKPQDAVAPGTTPFYVNTIKRPWLPREQHPRRAGVSAFGFGGSNFHCVLEEHETEKSAPDFDGAVQIIALSGANADDIQRQLQPLLGDDITWSQLRDTAHASRAAFDNTTQCRLALVLERTADWKKAIADAVKRLKQETGAPWSTAGGAYYGVGAADGDAAVLFPGQGAQYVGMLRALACTFPEMIDTLATFDAAYESATGTRLVDRVYPHPAFDDATKRAQDEALQSTETTQPALGAVGVGAWRVLRRFGVSAEAFGGHSYGELAALCAAGRFDEAALARLSIERGRLMAGDGSDRGAMFAVRADVAAVEQVLVEEALDLILANHNAPNQVVLSGATAEIARAEKVFKARGLRGTRLQVAAAFHSPLVADAATPFRQAVGGVVWNESATKVYANTTGETYPADATVAADLLAHQLARPVAFVREIEQMYADGVRTFIEAGPGARLSGLVAAILGNRAHATVAIDASNGRKDGMGDLARALAQLAAEGRAIALQAWDAAHTPAPRPDGKPRFTVSLTGANYRDPKKAQALPPRATPVKGTGSPKAETAGPRMAQTAADDGAQLNGDRKANTEVTRSESEPQSSRHDMESTRVNGGVVADMLRQTDAHLDALRQMQASTADLHRQFLNGQEQAAQRYHALLQQQEQLFARYADAGERGVLYDVTRETVAKNPAGNAAAATPSPVHSAPASPAATASAAPAAHAAPAVAEPAQDEALTCALLAIVSEKTGYPVEMLSLEMALDADLGIDSIKRVEILSALQEQMPELPHVEGEDLGKLQTLGDVVAQLASRGTGGSPVTLGEGAAAWRGNTPRPSGTPLKGGPVGHSGAPLKGGPGGHSGAPFKGGPVGHSRTPLGEDSRATDADVLRDVLLAIVSEKTGYPVEMLSLEMALDADLGIDSIKRVEILSALQEQMPELPHVEGEDLGKLQTLGDVVAQLASRGTGGAPVTLGEGAAALRGNTPRPSGTPLKGGPVGHSGTPLKGGPVEHSGTPLKGGPGGASADAREGGTGMADAGALQEALLAIVSEKTGYPVEMLSLDMALDADLGIDSIKRVEILSALQEQLPQLPAVESEELGQLQTLRDVIVQLSNSGPTVPGPSPIRDTPGETTFQSALSTSSQSIPPPRALAEDQTGPPLRGVAEGRGVSPRDGGAPSDAPLHRYVVRVKPLGEPHAGERFKLRPNARIAVTDEGSDVSRAIVSRLQRMEYDARSVAPNAPADAWANLDGLIVVAPEVGCNAAYLSQALAAARAASADLRQRGAADAAVFATVSRLDGAFGLRDAAGDTNAEAGALAGLLKTARHEWPEVQCKAIDLAGDFASADDAAIAVIDDVLGNGHAEVGLSAKARVTLELSEPPVQSPPGRIGFEADDVVVVTGGARGVTADAALALADAGAGTLILVGRSSMESEGAELRGIQEEGALKQALLRISAEKLSPKELESRFRRVVATREIRATLAEIERRGARAVYESVDVRDGDAVRDLITRVQAEYGPVSAFVHGAGVLADRHIADVTAKDFAAVYDTKVRGFQNFLEAMQDNILKAVVVFSSSTARFGRTGQVAYAMANEALNKLAQAESRRRRDCRVAAMNWGPWDGGMVTPSLRRLFEAEGVGVIGRRAGGLHLVHELVANDGAVETVVLAAAPDGRTPAVVEEMTFDEKAGAPSEARAALSFMLNSETHPFLRDHVLDGKCVLPLAMFVEWFAHAALHSQPGYRFRSIEDLRVLKGVLLETGESRELRIYTAAPQKRAGGGVLVAAELRSVDGAGKETLHGRAQVVLDNSYEAAPAPTLPVITQTYGKGREHFYGGDLLFHGATFHGLHSVEGCSPEGISAIAATAPRPAEWVRDPMRRAWLADPLVLDCAFQALILWSFKQRGNGSLPVYVKEFRPYQSGFPKGRVHINARITQATEHRAVSDVEFVNPANGQLLARMNGYECVIDSALNRAFQRNAAAAERQG